MSDIFGRSTIKPADGIKKKQISSMIKRYLTSRLNLVDVDPGEIVVFETDKGKLKTSNISFDNLLMKPEGVADDSIAVFKQGKITAGDKLSSITDQLTVVNDTAADLKLLIDDLAKFFGSPRQHMDIQITHIKAAIDNLSALKTAYDNHVRAFGNFRNNIVEKFLGKDVKPKDITPTLAEIKTTFANNEEDRKKLTDDIAAINSRLGVWISPDPITTMITSNKQEINSANIKINNIREIIGNITNIYIPDISKSIEDIKIITNKVKIPHDTSKIKSLSYVVHQEYDMEYIPTSVGYLKEIGLSSWYETITGIYRFTVFSKHQFNILISVRDDEAGLTEITYTGVNTVLLYVNDVKKNYTANVKPVDANVARVKFGYILEYVSAID